MRTKQQIIKETQTWVMNELMENKLRLLVEIPSLINLELEQIQLVDFEYRTAYTSDNSREHNEYDVTVFIFNLGNEVVELSADDNGDFGGVYRLEDYWIYYDGDDGTELIKQVEYPALTERESHPLETALNAIDFVSWNSGEEVIDLHSQYTKELEKENLISIKGAQMLLEKVIATEPYGINHTMVKFASGVSIKLENSSVKKYC